VGFLNRATIAPVNVVATLGIAALGAGIGALLPLPTYRLSVPTGSTAAVGCPHCEEPLPARLRGWVGHGACRSCGTPLTTAPWRYVAVVAIVFAMLAWRLPRSSLTDSLLFAAWLIFAGAGIWLAAIDLRVRRLPTTIVGGAVTGSGSLIVAAALVSARPGLAVAAGIAAASLGLAHLVLAVLSPGQLGMGDVRLAALCGLLLGPQGWGTVVLGAALSWLLSAAFAGALLVGRRVGRETLIPLGPFLITGTLLAALVTSG
jgi:leader peptidase (prepilin peptidase)/N-methyltransferase